MDADGCDSRVVDDFNMTEKFKGTSKMASGWYATISVTEVVQVE